MLSIAMALTLVVGSAYALFSSQVSVNGITLATTDANLLVRIGNQPETAFTNSLTIPQVNQLAKLVPGEVSDPGVFVYRNNGDLDLKLTSVISSAEGDWNALKDVIQVVTCRVELSGGFSEGMHCPVNGPTSTGWKTLADWNTNPIGINGSNGIIEAGEDALFVTNFRIPADASNAVSGKSITNMEVIVTGTQVTP